MKNHSLHVFGAVAAIVMFALTVSFLCGCRSVKPDCPEPDQKIIWVDKPIPCIIDITPLPPAVLPTPPPFPVDTTDEELKKAWALAVGEIIEHRNTLFTARDAAWLAKVTTNNAGIPKCSTIPTPAVPTPTP